MNVYELSRTYWDYAFRNPDKIKPNHSAMYFFAIEHCNRLGWKEKFGFPTTIVMEAIGIKSYNTFINTLKELVEFGFIVMIEKSKNQYSANIIALSTFNKASDEANNKALDEALIKHSAKHDESTEQSTDSIDKQTYNTTNTQNYKLEAEASDDIFSEVKKEDFSTVVITEAKPKEKSSAKKERFTIPSLVEVQNYCNERQNGVSAFKFLNFYQSKDWMVGKNKMKDWKAAVRTWESDKPKGTNQTKVHIA